MGTATNYDYEDADRLLGGLADEIERELGGITGEHMDEYERDGLIDELRALEDIARTLRGRLER